MKTLKLLITVSALLLASNVQGQFFKKLKKRAEEAAKETVMQKAEEKASKETEKVFDSTFNNQGNLFKKKRQAPAEFYDFTHSYVMRIESGKNTTDLTYHLKEGANYLGSSTTLNENERVMNVIDIERQTAYVFMDMNQQKSTMSFGLNFEEEREDEIASSEIEITQTGNSKMIVGYLANEYIVNGNNLEGNLWITDEADVSFTAAFYKIKTTKFKVSKKMDQSWMADIDGLTLEMHITDTSKKQNNTVKMTCISLEEVPLVIESASFKKAF